MKRQSILFILLLLLNIFICCGCSADEKIQSESSPSLTSGDIAIPDTEEQGGATEETATGIFEGLEGNHTAIFSFDGVETAFHFEDPAVQKILFEAIAGSSYTLSYSLDPTTDLLIIDEISE